MATARLAPPATKSAVTANETGPSAATTWKRPRPSPRSGARRPQVTSVVPATVSNRPTRVTDRRSWPPSIPSAPVNRDVWPSDRRISHTVVWMAGRLGPEVTTR